VTTLHFVGTYCQLFQSVSSLAYTFTLKMKVMWSPRMSVLSKLHGITSQKTVFFNCTIAWSTKNYTSTLLKNLRSWSTLSYLNPLQLLKTISFLTLPQSYSPVFSFTDVWVWTNLLCNNWVYINVFPASLNPISKTPLPAVFLWRHNINNPENT
jgi:hypothetical protein